MKTVMKKMFCLLLVAVMLVSAVPVAFADDTVKCTHCNGTNISPNQALYGKDATCDEDGTYGYYCHECAKSFTHGTITKLGHEWGTPYLSVEPTCTTYGTEVRKCGVCGETEVTNDKVPAILHTMGDATCTDPKKCTVCGTPSTDPADAALGHDWDNATCTAPKTCSRCGATEGTATGHSYGSDNVCDICKYCNNCGKTITGDDANNHDTTCKFHPDFNKECPKCGTKYTALETHPTCDHCENVNAGASNPCHATANCPYCLVCLEKNDYVKLHKTADHCELCGKTDGTHKTDCKNYNGSGSSYVKIHVNLYTSDTYTATKELVVYKDSSSDTIYYSLAEHNDLIVSELKKQYPDYSWSGHVYEAIKGDDGVEMSDEIGNGVTVYINAYCAEDLVLIAVHNGRTMSTLGDGYIHLYGKKVGETITRSEVKKAVSKQYNYSSLSMYSEQAWEDYVDGASVNSVDSLKITSDPYFIDVRISGASKVTSSGSSYSADSSNPKTGDTIFAPIMIMGASVSALAVLFYLNKKRAY